MLAVLILSLGTGAAPALSTMPGVIDAARLASLFNASGPDTKAGQSICIVYVAGAVDELMAQQARRGAPRRSICPPKAMP